MCICTLCQDSDRAVTFSQLSPLAVRRMKILVGQEMSRNTGHTPDAVLTCRESVAIIQIKSESVERSQRPSMSSGKII